MWRDLFFDPHVKVKSLGSIAQIYINKIDFSSAKRILLQALTLGESHYVENDHRLGILQANTANVEYRLNDFPTAEKHALIAIEILKKRVNCKDEKIHLALYTQSLLLLGGIYSSTGRDCEAIELVKEVLLLRAKEGENEEYAGCLFYLIGLYAKLELNDQAITEGKKLIEIYNKIYGQCSEKILPALKIVRVCCLSKGQYLEAISLLEEEYRIRQLFFGPKDVESEEIVLYIAKTYTMLGDKVNADRYYSRHAELFKQVHGKEKGLMILLDGETIENRKEREKLGTPQLKRTAEARSLSELEAVLFSRISYGENSEEVAQAYLSIAEYYAENGYFENSIEKYLDAVRIFEKDTKSWWPVAVIYTAIGSLYLKYQNQPALAISSFEKALYLCQNTVNFTFVFTNHKVDHLVKLLDLLGQAHGTVGDLMQRVEYQKKALNIAEKALGSEHEVTLRCMHNLANGQYLLKNYQEAKALMTTAFVRRRKLFGDNDVRTKNSKVSLDHFCFHESLDETLTFADELKRIDNSIHHSDVDEKFGNIAVSKLSRKVKEFQKPDESLPPSYEVAFRRAAAKGTADDLWIFLGYIKMIPNYAFDINSKSPSNGRTALHWAVICKRNENAIFLLDSYASPDILDIQGKTPREYDGDCIIQKYYLSISTKIEENCLIEQYCYAKKTEIENANYLIRRLNERTQLKFVGLVDDYYNLDAILRIITAPDLAAVVKLKEALNGFGKYFKIDEITFGYVLEGINSTETERLIYLFCMSSVQVK